MGKKKNNRAKRSLSKLPKGLVQKQGGGPSSFADINPFEVTARQKKPKHEVLNRPVAKAKTTKNTLESLQRRQTQLRSTLKSSKKANVFVDRRIGQYDPNMSKEDQMLARLVKERSRQSQRISKFRLDDDGDDDVGGGDFFLTHKGKRLDPNQSEAIYSDDDDDDNGNLAAVDTELHFGGGGINKNNVDPYGGSSAADLQQVYAHRKTELDDLIARRKMMKAEKMQTKEAQVETVEQMDETFGDLSGLLRFRKNEKPPLEKPKPTQEDQEMNEWNKDLKELMMKPKRKATDRTKTPEEIAKEEAERLHELETRRLARMNGDFEEDDFSDIEVDSRKKKKKDKRKRNDEDLSESDDEDEEKVTPRFTADGLVYLDKEGNIVKKAGEEGQDDVGDENSSSSDDGNDDGDENEVRIPLAVGQKVRGNYRAAEQYDGHESWYDGVISKVHRFPDGSIKYDVEYNDGDSEENMIPANVKPIEDPTELAEKNAVERENQEMLKLKRKIAKDKARYVEFRYCPFIFAVPTKENTSHLTATSRCTPISCLRDVFGAFCSDSSCLTPLLAPRTKRYLIVPLK
jgi:nucleolar protein 14